MTGSTHHSRLLEVQQLGHAYNKANSQRNYIVLLRPLLWPSGEPWLRFRLVLSFLLLLMAKTISVSTPVAYKLVIDNISSTSRVALYICLYGAGRFLSGAMSDVRDAIFAKVTQWIIHESAMMAFSQCHSLSVEYHIRKRSTGSLVRIIDRGTKAISQVLQQVLFSILPTSLEVLLVVVLVSTVFSYSIALVMLAFILLYVLYTLICTEWRLRLRRDMNDKENLAAGVLLYIAC